MGSKANDVNNTPEGSTPASNEPGSDFPKPRIRTAAEVNEANMVREYSKPGTPEAEMFDNTFLDISEKIPGLDGQRLRMPHTHDSLTVSDRLREQMGVKPEEEVCWVRREDWRGTGEDRPGEFLDTNEGGRIPVHLGGPNKGKHKFNKDMMLVARPMALTIEMERQRNDRAADFISEAPNQESDMSEKEMKELREQNRHALGALLHNSPTRGMTLERAASVYNEAQTREIRDRYLYHGRTRPQSDKENTTDRIVETIKNDIGKKSLHSIGAGFDKSGKLIRA